MNWVFVKKEICNKNYKKIFPGHISSVNYHFLTQCFSLFLTPINPYSTPHTQKKPRKNTKEIHKTLLNIFSNNIYVRRVKDFNAVDTKNVERSERTSSSDGSRWFHSRILSNQSKPILFWVQKKRKIAKRKTNFHELKLMVKIWANNMSFPIYTVVGYVQFALNVASYLLFKTSPLSNDADVDII